MGIYDRDYYREPAGRSSFGGMKMWSVNTWLIAINIAVFVLDSLFVQSYVDNNGYSYPVHPINAWGYFSINAAIVHFQVWRFLTFQFLHDGLPHIAFNMIALYFFGPMIESYFGARKYLAFYLICGFAGALAYIGLCTAGVLIHDPASRMVGASAGIFGVLIAASQIAPNAQVLLYGIVPMRLRVLAWLALGYAAFNVITEGYNAGGDAAHLGGAAAGFLLLKNSGLLRFADFGFRRGMRYRG